MSRYLREFGFLEKDIALGAAIVSSDIMGPYIQGRIAAAAATERVAALAESAGRHFSEFVEILLVYYQVDAGSYTADAGGVKSLDYLFEFERQKGNMRFSLSVEAKVGFLRVYARELPHSRWLTDREWHDVAPKSLKTWVRHRQGELARAWLNDQMFTYRRNPATGSFQISLSGPVSEALYTPRSMGVYDHDWHPLPKEDFMDWVEKRVPLLDSGQELRGRMFRYRRNAESGTYEVRLTHKLESAQYCP